MHVAKTQEYRRVRKRVPCCIRIVIICLLKARGIPVAQANTQDCYRDKISREPGSRSREEGRGTASSRENNADLLSWRSGVASSPKCPSSAGFSVQRSVTAQISKAFLGLRNRRSMPFVVTPSQKFNRSDSLCSIIRLRLMSCDHIFEGSPLVAEIAIY